MALLRRTILVGIASIAGGCVGLVVWFIGFAWFTETIYGEGALTHSDGKANFYDRTTWWDITPLAGALIAGLVALLALRCSNKRRTDAGVTRQPDAAR